MKTASKDHLKSATTIEDDISGKQDKETHKFEDFYEELEIIGEVFFLIKINEKFNIKGSTCNC